MAMIATIILVSQARRFFRGCAAALRPATKAVDPEYGALLLTASPGLSPLSAALAGVEVNQCGRAALARDERQCVRCSSAASPNSCI